MIIGIENTNFRGPLLMMVPENFLKSVLGYDLKMREFKNPDKINKTYMDIINRLFLPATQYYKNTVKEVYKENPESALNASLAGKKQKEPSGR